MKVQLKIPATTANLGPGFDTLGLALNIANYLEVETIADGLEISVFGQGEQELSQDHNNLVYQGIEYVFRKLKKDVPGLKITQRNEIPLSRGLGSSAAAIVGGLVAANELLGRPLTINQLLDTACQIEGHPDNVAPALLGGLVVSCLDNNQVKYCNIKPAKPLDVVIVIPDFKLSTQATRAILPEKVDFSAATYNASRVGLLVGSFYTGDYSLLKAACKDRLHQNYRAKLIPGFNAVLDAAIEANGLAAALSGAGPSVVAFTTDDPEKLGRAMQQAFAEHQINSDFVITNINNQGIEVLDSTI